MMILITATSSGQNLISNGNFETGGQLRCDGWIDFCNHDLIILCDSIVPDTTCAVWFSQDSASGSDWSLTAYGIGNDPPWGAQTFVTGETGTNVYELKAWIKDSSYANGTIYVSRVSQGIITGTSLFLSGTDSTDWTQHSTSDTIFLLPGDTLIVTAQAIAAGPTAGEINFDQIELTKIDSNLVLPCIADAGPDVIDCLNDQDTVQLGGIPAVSFGLGPYTYAWECFYTGLSGNVWTASYFLDDTTIANPSVVHTTFEPLVFTLYVTDSLGNMCSDKVKVRRSNYEWTLLDQSASILLGDSVQLSSQVSGGIQPLTYAWSPTTALSDPFIVNPYASPVTSTNYQLTITDSIGCLIVEPDIWEVYVGVTSADELVEERLAIRSSPNPFSSRTNVTVGNEEIYSFRMYNSLGQLVSGRSDINQSTLVISGNELLSGLYHLHVSISNGKSGWGKLVVE